MATESDIHVILVEEIEKYPFLYNYKLPEYSRRDVTERAWAEISNKTRLSINDCKEKWRNIRSTFLRSLKTQPSGSKPKKPYYLREYLTFILPYVKPLNQSSNCGNIPSAQENDTSPIDAEPIEEEQTPTSVTDELQGVRQLAPSEQSTSAATLAPATSSPPNTQLHGMRRRRKVATNEVDDAMIQFLKKKTEKQKEPDQCQNENPSMNHFFLSLLPEFTNMTEQQIRTFKIKVLQLIDDIKQTGQSSTTSSRDSFYVCSPISSVGTPAPIDNQQFPSPYEGSSSSDIPKQYSSMNLAQTLPHTQATTQAQTLSATPSPVHMPYENIIPGSPKNDSFSYAQLQ